MSEVLGKERIAMSTYRLRKLAIGMLQFTANDLAAAAGVNKQAVHDFLQTLREANSEFLRFEELPATGPGRRVKRYQITPDGVGYLIEQNAPISQAVNESAFAQNPKLRPGRSNHVRPLHTPWSERIGGWLERVYPQFQGAIDRHASAVLIKPDESLAARVGQSVVPLPDAPAWSMQDVQNVVEQILTPWQQRRLERQGWTASAYCSPNHPPLDLHVRLVSGKPLIEVRFLPSDIPTLETMRLSPLVREFLKPRSGLILVGGLAQSGRSRTIAAMIENVNASQAAHITTIEEPVHYFHERQKSFIEQRQVAIDTPDFISGLQQALAENSGIVALSDITDYDTLEIALAAAQRTLVVARVAASRPAEAIRKLAALFSEREQGTARARLADVLVGIIFVQAFPDILGRTKVSGAEILRLHPEARDVIIDPEKTSAIATELARFPDSVETMQESVRKLYREGQVSEEVVERFAEAVTVS